MLRTGLCVTFYSVIFPFRSTFAIKYFQHAHHLSLQEAGQLNGYVFLAAIFATPAFGLLVVLPNFLWQAARGYPFLELVHNGLLHKNVLLSPARFLANVAFEANPGNLPLWLGGLLWLLLAARARGARFVGVGCLLQLLALTFGHAKPYYAGGILPILLAAGGAAFATLVPIRLVQQLACATLALSALLFGPLAVPLLPEETFLAYQRTLGMAPTPTEKLAQSALPQTYADMHGWHEVVEGVARVYRALPPAEQARAAVLNHSYGVPSAVEVLGPEHGLPRGLAVSGHNSFWYWGMPAGRGDPLIVVGGPFEDCGGTPARSFRRTAPAFPGCMGPKCSRPRPR